MYVGFDVCLLWAGIAVYYLLSGIFVLNLTVGLGFDLFCFVWVVICCVLISICGCLICGLFCVG